MAPETPIVGQVLGHYRVLEQIGAGGMGLVFRASDQQLERDVAIKVLPPGMLADEAARKRSVTILTRWRRLFPGVNTIRPASILASGHRRRKSQADGEGDPGEQLALGRYLGPHVKTILRPPGA
jgi:serine/threonine protein kinase